MNSDKWVSCTRVTFGTLQKNYRSDTYHFCFCLYIISLRIPTQYVPTSNKLYPFFIRNSDFSSYFSLTHSVAFETDKFIQERCDSPQHPNLFKVNVIKCFCHTVSAWDFIDNHNILQGSKNSSFTKIFLIKFEQSGSHILQCVAYKTVYIEKKGKEQDKLMKMSANLSYKKIQLIYCYDMLSILIY